MNEQISIQLSSGISYVYGTVNGVEASFNLSAPGIWSAVVEKSDDGIYVVLITAYNNAGTPTTINKIVYSHVGWLEPKLDWDSNDYYNFGDLNRVENNTIFVVEMISAFDIPPIIDSDVSRDLKSIEFADGLNRVESNVSLLKQRYTPFGWIENKLDWESNQPFNYDDAARLEKNLALLHFYYRGNIDNFRHCGMYTCGEEVI
ncbi:hypothetical protein [Sporosarcina sp. FA9]|uniref:hypothetical protein n=1 Tax=Sporosarcina sp. FA9 TaxID=3413030 RepID=UPI003F65A4C0